MWPVASARRYRPRCAARRSTCRAATSGVPQEFLAHASRGEVLAEVGLTDQHIARQITGWIAALNNSVSESEVSQRFD